MVPEVGKKYGITGMAIEVIADAGDKWQLRNLTTREVIYMDKSILLNAVRMGKAEELEETGE